MSQLLPGKPGAAGAELAPELAPGEPPQGGEASEGATPTSTVAKPRRRRRGSRGGRGRRASTVLLAGPGLEAPPDEDGAPAHPADGRAAGGETSSRLEHGDGPPLGQVAPAEGVPTFADVKAGGGRTARPKIGDTRPGTQPVPTRAAGGGRLADRSPTDQGQANQDPSSAASAMVIPAAATTALPPAGQPEEPPGSPRARRRRRAAPPSGAAIRAPAPGRAGGTEAPAAGLGAVTGTGAQDEGSGRRGARGRRPRPLGRYLMAVHVGPTATQIAVLEGRALIEHYVSRPADDTTQIDGNIYLGRVQNVLPGMEAAFVDIGTPKNAVLYRGDLRFDEEEVEGPGDDQAKPTRARPGSIAHGARIEQVLRTGQSIVCQVTKNPIGTKGARLTQEVSLPGRFVVLIPNSETYGISKRLPDEERKRLRRILDDIRPPGQGLIVRTAAEGASADELSRDVSRLLSQWEQVESLARSSRAPKLLYREPDLAVRVIREEFNRDYRGVVIDDRRLYEQVRDYVARISPELVDRVELADQHTEALPLFERFRVHEQIHKALDRKVWLPSGGSIIIERTEALTVIDVNTGKNVGTSNLEETVFRNNLEAAEEIARQLRLRDIGGIIVIDFIDMEIASNRAEVIRTFREALARDKTRSQVFDISELGLVEMTRKRISEGLVESYSDTCPTCGGRGIVFDESLL
jgi:ribonuclease E